MCLRIAFCEVCSVFLILPGRGGGGEELAGQGGSVLTSDVGHCVLGLLKASRSLWILLMACRVHSAETTFISWELL